MTTIKNRLIRMVSRYVLDKDAALAYGMTHEAILYGCDVWIKMNGSSNVLSIPKFMPFGYWTDFCYGINGFFLGLKTKPSYYELPLKNVKKIV